MTRAREDPDEPETYLDPGSYALAEALLKPKGRCLRCRAPLGPFDAYEVRMTQNEIEQPYCQACYRKRSAEVGRWKR